MIFPIPASVWLATLFPSVLAGTIQKPLQSHKSAVAHRDAAAVAEAVTKPRKLQGRFLHITDIHPDPFYKIYSSSKEDIACHRGKGPAGYYGAETSDCDSPFSLVNATFDWLEQNLKDKIDFIIWTGDSARHDNDEHHPRNADQVLGQNQLLVDKFKKVFKGNEAGRKLEIPIVPSFGNNDILPHNILLKGPNKWTKEYADIWRPFIPEEQRHGFDRGGWFYVEVIPNKLAVFSLNTMYFFDSNTAVDGCSKTNQPGYEHMEWLRIQLQFLRGRGVKAIMSGHVPPARNGEKIGWDETCWQKYTLWMQQYRDVVVGSVYGHMNIEHFILQDFKDIDYAVASGVKEPDADFQIEDDDKVSIKVSPPDYLMALRDIWSKLPAVPEGSAVLKSESGTSPEVQGRKKKRAKHKRSAEEKFYDKIGGEFAERFSVSHISASVVPNFFSTMRVFEYNVTGLEDAATANQAASSPVPQWPEREDEDDDQQEIIPNALAGTLDSLQSALTELFSRLPSPSLPLSPFDPSISKHRKHKKHRNHRKHRRKHPKKNKPKFTVPDGPSHTSPPGPAYSPQPFSWLGYRQYVANITYLNDDFTTHKGHEGHDKGDEVVELGWNPGRYVDEKPGKRGKHGEDGRGGARPREFAYQLEYDTRDAKDDYRMGEGLTVRKWVELASRIGEFRGEGEDDAIPQAEDVEEQGDDGSDVIPEDSVDDGLDDQDEEAPGLEGEKHGKHHKKKKNKHKKKRKRRKIINRDWFAFVSRAVTGTLSDEELHEGFGDVEVDGLEGSKGRWDGRYNVDGAGADGAGVS